MVCRVSIGENQSMSAIIRSVIEHFINSKNQKSTGKMEFEGVAGVFLVDFRPLGVLLPKKCA
jgi:hypothetical protein